MLVPQREWACQATCSLSGPLAEKRSSLATPQTPTNRLFCGSEQPNWHGRRRTRGCTGLSGIFYKERELPDSPVTNRL